MATFLADNPFLLLFLVAAIGFLLGRVSIGGFRLGVAAVLFVGLGFGALGPEVELPDVVYLLGLIVFVYTVGLAGGPGFFEALRRKGLRDNLLTLGVLVGAAGLVLVAAAVLGLGGPAAGGLFAGSLTNTPALAGILQSLTDTLGVGADRELAVPVVAYSVAYPVGVLGVILAIHLLRRWWSVDYAEEAGGLTDQSAVGEDLVGVTVEVTRDLGGRTVQQLGQTDVRRVLFGRVLRGGHQRVVSGDTRLEVGDLVSLVGTPEPVDRAVAYLGVPAAEALPHDRSELKNRRISVSNNEVAGRTLADLDLPGRFGALATRVRRGDVDVLARSDLRILPGDRLRVVAPRGRIGDVSAYLGDSAKLLSEIDIGVFGLGIAVGLLLGLVPVPLPGGGAFRLGPAGGPLVVGLVMGALVRTGPIVWQLPYNANLTLRQFGVILFLAGIGTRSGYEFASEFADGGVPLFVAGALVTCATTVAMLVVGHRLLHIPMSLLIGMVAGMQTQPAVLAYAGEQTRNELPNVGYAAVFPVATIAKIVLAQVILLWR